MTLSVATVNTSPRNMLSTEDILLCSSSPLQTIAVQLPDPSTVLGQEKTVSNVGQGYAVVSSAAGRPVQNVASYNLYPNQHATFVPDPNGLAWWIVG